MRGKSVPYLKVNTNRKKPIPVAGDLVQVLEELEKIHKDTYLKSYLLFVNSIPLFITLSIRYDLHILTISPTEKWRPYSRISKRHTVIT